MTRRKLLAIAAIVLVCIPVALYAFLFALQAYSVWQASRTLDRLEALRIGDPAEDFDKAVRLCKSGYGVYGLTAGAYRPKYLWDHIYKLPQELADQVPLLASRVGLRWWDLTTSATFQEGKIATVSTRLWVVGRYEMLGAHWQIASTVPSSELLDASKDIPTYMRWFHITSMPSGEGFKIDATARTSEKELSARRINRTCLISSRGCDGLCEMLPDAVPVLEKQGRTWVGCTGAPASHCDLKYDRCRGHLSAAR